ncbi:uncharacterized protein si:dkeyp-69c1.9 [Scomber scombrus]|uniref:uncharacterized protein si:dkeyp-69c1.9 n=1 Tax=Scomber scombrus TaxID=13677 RepID=UPI002DDAFC6D|nr:uncharacterized protein si:dkeyp-69c1.9 [Scomber scombrus]
MPVNPQHSQEPTETMFIENVILRQPRHNHGFFQRARPYRGEPPTVAGFLLYPDTPAKMETTSREAFCFRPITQPHRSKGEHVALNSQQEFLRSQPTSLRQTGRGNSSKDREPGKDMQEGDLDQIQDTTELQSQYQKDFPPPSSCRRRRTPALPQPDNIGINPAFRIEFRTVQRETYPGWPILNPRCAARLRVASSGNPNTTSER